jgi:hypothetical protein
MMNFALRSIYFFHTLKGSLMCHKSCDMGQRLKVKYVYYQIKIYTRKHIPNTWFTSHVLAAYRQARSHKTINKIYRRIMTSLTLISLKYTFMRKESRCSSRLINIPASQWDTRFKSRLQGPLSWQIFHNFPQSLQANVNSSLKQVTVVSFLSHTIHTSSITIWTVCCWWIIIQWNQRNLTRTR